MILSPKLKNVNHPKFDGSHPSNSRIRYLKPDSVITVELLDEDYSITCIVLFRRYEDVVAKVTYTPSKTAMNEIRNGDLIFLHIENILTVIPKAEDVKLYPFMLISTKDGDQEFIIHTHFPKFIAVVHNDTESWVEVIPVQLYDVPDTKEELEKIVKKAQQWYYGSFKKKSAD